MAEPKEHSVNIHLEDTFYEILVSLARKSNRSMSSYIRSLLIDDFRKRGLVTEQVLAEVLS